ncbi:MAG: hypothetical protein AB7D92_09675 [Sphaerochaeta sp.]
MKQSRKQMVSPGKQDITKTIGILMMFFLIISAPSAFANTDLGMGMNPLSLQIDDDGQAISDQELTRFRNTLMGIQQMEVEANAEIEQVIKHSELSIETLDEIIAMQTNNPEDIQASFEKEEIEEFTAVMQAINTIYITAQKNMHGILQENSYTLESFNRIAEVIQEDEELLGRLQSLFSEKG